MPPGYEEYSEDAAEEFLRLYADEAKDEARRREDETLVIRQRAFTDLKQLVLTESRKLSRQVLLFFIVIVIVVVGLGALAYHNSMSNHGLLCGLYNNASIHSAHPSSCPKVK